MKYYIGVDPSTVSTGVAVLDENGELVQYGTINPPTELDHHDKLAYQFEQLKATISLYGNNIQSIVCEEQFGGPSIDTLKKITRTCAIVMLVASLFNIELHMMYPVSWRKIFHNDGAANKADTLKLVNEIHSLQLKKKDNDIADAIAMATCGWKIAKKESTT